MVVLSVRPMGLRVDKQVLMQQSVRPAPRMKRRGVPCAMRRRACTPPCTSPINNGRIINS